MHFIEHAARHLFLGVLARAFGVSHRRVSLPDWRARPYRVLFIRNDGIGDLIVSIPALRAIADSSPTLTLDVLASPRNAELAHTLPFVHEVIVHERGFLPRSWPVWRRLRRNHYDAVVDGRVVTPGVSTQTTCLILSTRAPWRIGIGGRRNDRVYSVPIEAGSLPLHLDRIAALTAPFGIDRRSGDWRPRLALSREQLDAAERRWLSWGTDAPRVLLNITAGHPDRRWPDERWAAVLARLRERLPAATIAVLAMPPDFASATNLASTVGATPVTLSLPETIASVATADLVITPDSAVSHIASAFERLTLNLMRKGFERWIPFSTPGRNVFGDDPRLLSGLSVPPVLGALDELISERFSRSR